MADEQDREREFRYHDYSADGEPFDPARDRPAEADKQPIEGAQHRPIGCTECRGTGKVMLLISTKPCKACGGTGKVVTAISPEDLQDSAQAGSASSAQAGSASPPEATSPPGISLPPVVRRSYGYPDDEEEGGGAMVEMVEERVTGHWETTTTFDAQNRVRSVMETFVPDLPEGLKT